MSVIIPLPETVLGLYPDNMITKKLAGGQGLFVEHIRPIDEKKVEAIQYAM